MFRVFFLICLFFSLEARPFTITDSKDKTAALFQCDCKPTQELKELLQLDGLYDPNDRLPEILAKTQKHWFAVERGKGGILRSDLPDTDNLKQVASIVERMGLFTASDPVVKHYDYAVVLGACKAALHARILYLLHLYHQGFTFNSVVFLVGDRPLRADEGSVDENEYDLARKLWSETNVPFSVPVYFVNTPREGSLFPSTKTTYQEWIKTFEPKPGSVLAISSPFFVWQQHMVGKKVLNRQWALDTVAPAVTEETLLSNPNYFKASVILDTIAKMIYDADITVLCSRRHGQLPQSKFLSPAQ